MEQDGVERCLEPEELREIELAVDEFLVATRVRKQALASALGIRGDQLSRSHLDRWGPIFWAFRNPNVGEVAERLQLSASGYAALCHLVKRVQEVFTPPKTPLHLAVEQGRLGISLYQKDNWPLAIPHLLASWEALVPGGGLEASYRHFATTVDVGVQLLDWLVHQKDSNGCKRVVSLLNGPASNYRGGDRETCRAVAGSYRSIAIALRGEPLNNPVVVARKSESAYQILSERQMDLPTQLAGLRDQWKPLAVRGAGWWKHAPPQPELLVAAHAKLQQARRLARGGEDEELLDHWLLTEVAYFHYLVLIGHEGEYTGLKLWERLNADARVVARLADKNDPIVSYVRFSGLGTCLWRRQLGELESTVTEYLTDARNARYHDRLCRARAMLEAARVGEWDSALKAYSGWETPDAEAAAQPEADQ